MLRFQSAKVFDECRQGDSEQKINEGKGEAYIGGCNPHGSEAISVVSELTSALFQARPWRQLRVPENRLDEGMGSTERPHFSRAKQVLPL